MEAKKELPNFGRCTQRVCLHFSTRLGLAEAQAARMGTAFGSGMGRAETCGCVSGALLVLGLLYGADAVGEPISDELRKRVALFEERFLEQQKSLLCKDILGVDISCSKGMETAMAQGIISSTCGPLIAATCAILDDITQGATAPQE